ncbi:aromatic amino acid transport family protein [Shigella flexneri]
MTPKHYQQYNQLPSFLYILTYAYISANGAMHRETISMNLGYHANPRIVGISPGHFVPSVLWISSLAAVALPHCFLGLKIISFCDSIEYISTSRSSTPSCAMPPAPLRERLTSRIFFMALPVCLASFGFTAIFPSLIICYGKRKDS